MTAEDGKRRARRGAPEPGDTRPFEAMRDELDAIIVALEDGNVPLDEQMALYERGMRLAQACQRRLDNARLRVSALRAAADSAGDNTVALDTIEIEGM